MHKAHHTIHTAASLGTRRSSTVVGLGVVSVVLAVVCVGCATAPVSSSSPEPRVVTWEDKLPWMMRLEDQRVLRDPNPAPPVVLLPATSTQPAILAPAAPSDLILLLDDGEARVRWRAALALGRVGLPEAVEPLIRLLGDDEPDVRVATAFALGLIGSSDAREALLTSLGDADPEVQGRAAQALGMIGDPVDATAVSEMVQAHVWAGALNGLDPDEMGFPLAPAVEAARLGMYALARLGSFDGLAAAVLAAGGQPYSGWWPVASAFQQLGDGRGAPALLSLLNTPGRYTASFAARGLGALKEQAAVGPLRQIVEQQTAHEALVIQAIRALSAIGDVASVPVLVDIVLDADASEMLRQEAMMAMSPLATADSLDLLLDLLSDPSPPIRSAAFRTLARVAPDSFLAALSGLDPDPEWAVRAAEADALAALPQARGEARLRVLLGDDDPRVVSAVLAAQVASKVAGTEAVLLERLGSDDFGARGAAARGLAALGAIASVPALVQAYSVAQDDTTYVARAAILSALAELDPTAARPLLEDGLGDRDWAIRVRAAELLRSGGLDVDDGAIRPAPAGRAISDREWFSLVSPRFSPHVYIETDRGAIEFELAIVDAPLTVANFMTLARSGFYDGVAIHRVVPDFVVQAGDPRGDGEGGPGYTIRDEINMRPYLRGTVGMALDWPDTGGSQFFITHSPQPHLDGRYTVFGHVVAGMDVVDALVPGDVIRQVRIWDGETE